MFKEDRLNTPKAFRRDSLEFGNSLVYRGHGLIEGCLALIQGRHTLAQHYLRLEQVRQRFFQAAVPWFFGRGTPYLPNYDGWDFAA